MALTGRAIVAIWNDITEDGRENFHAWHNREHIPERLSISGFLRGRRYRVLPGARAGSPEYFTLYEVENAAVLSGPAYLARLNSPTDWTRASVRHFRNVARSLCVNELTHGAGSGGFLATFRFDCDGAEDAAVRQHFDAVFTSLLPAAEIVACHASKVDIDASSAKTAEQTGRPDNAVPRWVVLVETSTATAAEAAAALGMDGLAKLEVSRAACEAYALQFDLLAPVIPSRT